jgi:delta(3,5)-delta(2,4)-dienoyl-CoA isomerase
MEYFRLEKNNQILEIILNKPSQLNTMDDQFFEELNKSLNILKKDNNLRVCIIWAEGRMFSAGLDLKSNSNLFLSNKEEDHVSQSLKIYHHLKKWQKTITKIQKISKPTIAAIHGNCIGSGVDLITACDIRLCTKNAVFSIKETQLAIVADLGTLQVKKIYYYS